MRTKSEIYCVLEPEAFPAWCWVYHTFPLFSFYSSRFTANLLGWNIQSLNPIGRFQMMTKLIGRHLIRFTLVLVKVWMVMTFDYLKNQRQLFVSHELKVLIALFHNWLCFKEILKIFLPYIAMFVFWICTFSVTCVKSN